MEGVAPVDAAVGLILAVAVARGLIRGLIRETFSIAALAAACLCVKAFNPQVAPWLEEVTRGQIGALAAPWIAGAAIGFGAVFGVVLIGRAARKSARWAGLGWADRAGGALLGAAEGALVVGILLVLASNLLGRGHPVLADTRSLAALEEFEHMTRQPPIDVAAPPRS